MSATDPTAEGWQRLRAQMPSARRYAYFDHAAVAPITGPAGDVLCEWARDVAESGGVSWGAWRKRLEETRRLAAELLGADTREIALIRNTTEGVNLVAEGFPWGDGDNVIVFEGDFPTNLLPWQALAERGVDVRTVPRAAERFEIRDVVERCDARTRLVAVSWVGYATGFRVDLAALCEAVQSRGVRVFVDAIQGLGAFPLDVGRVPIDYLAADGHKWLLGPEGAGLFFVRRSRLEELRPLGLGWNSVSQAGDFQESSPTLKASAGRYEGGTYNVGGLAALGASLKLLLEVGVDRIAERILAVTGTLCERLRSLDIEIASDRRPEQASGIVSCRWDGLDPVAVRRRCLEAEIVVNFRSGRLRLSPHAYTDDEDLERLVEVLAPTRAGR